MHVVMPSSGTLRQVEANIGCDCNTSETDDVRTVVSSETLPNKRDCVSGTTYNFPGLCSTVKSKAFKAIAQWVNMLDVSCM